MTDSSASFWDHQKNDMSVEINSDSGGTILQSNGDFVWLITICQLNGRLVQL